MRTTWIRASVLLVTFVLLTTSAVSQGPDNKLPSPDTQQCDGCVSKVIQLPSSLKTYEMQDVVNLFRTIVELRIFSKDPLQHTISVTCTPEQLVVVEKLVAVLDELRTSGDRRTSILVHEPQNPPPAEESTQDPHKWKPEPELASSFIKVYYTPESSPEQIWTMVNTLRTKTQIARIHMLPSAHVVVIRGSSEKMAQADRLMK